MKNYKMHKEDIMFSDEHCTGFDNFFDEYMETSYTNDLVKNNAFTFAFWGRLTVISSWYIHWNGAIGIHGKLLEPFYYLRDKKEIGALLGYKNINSINKFLKKCDECSLIRGLTKTENGKKVTTYYLNPLFMRTFYTHDSIEFDLYMLFKDSIDKYLDDETIEEIRKMMTGEYLLEEENND